MILLFCVLQVLLQIADDFIEQVVSSSCQIAKHRKSNTLEVKDVQLNLGTNSEIQLSWYMGLGTKKPDYVACNAQSCQYVCYLLSGKYSRQTSLQNFNILASLYS